MMTFKSLRVKLLTIFGLCLLITVGAVVVYGIVSTRNTEKFVTDSSNKVAAAAAKELLLEKARVMGFSIQVELEAALDAARTLADVLSGTKDENINMAIDRDRINAMLRTVLERNETFVGVYTNWEPNALDDLDEVYGETDGHDHTGRFIPYWSRDEEGTIGLEPLVDHENQEQYDNGVRKGEYYLLPRERKKECAIDPHPYSIQGKIVWITSLVVPIMANDRFYGITGVNMRLDFIQSLVEQANAAFYAGAGKMAIVSHNGILAAISDNPELVGTHLKDWMPEDWQEDVELIRSGKEESALQMGNMEIIVPLKIGRTETPWAVIIELPEKAVLASARELAQSLRKRGRQDMLWQVRVGLGITLIALLIIRLVSKSIVTPLTKGVDFARSVAEGDLTADIDVKQKDEIGVLANALNDMKNRIGDVLKETGELIQAVQAGRLDSRGNTHEFTGGWRDFVIGVNTIIEAFVTPFTLMSVSIERLSKGDFTQTMSGNYKGDFSIIVKKLNAMITQLNEVVINVKSAADSVASDSQEMRNSSATLSLGASQQAAATEEVSASMQLMVANIGQNADNALQTEKIAGKAAEDALASGKAVGEAVEAMQKIAKKVAIIEDITSQTRMLSLNATIEAAKAQEHGRGFAVVASEVRSLAERSQTAATEITQLASSSVTVAEKAGEMLAKLVPDIQKTAKLVHEISAASKEQNIGAEYINRAIQQLDQVTQQNAATSEEMVSTAGELTSQAEQLQGAIAFFNVGEIEQTTPREQEHVDLQVAVEHKQARGSTQRDDYSPELGQIEEIGDDQDEEFERY